MALNKNQQRVYEWLNDDLSLPVFAEAYKGAVILINQKTPGYVSFVAHAGRDLMNNLASTYVGIVESERSKSERSKSKKGRVQYQKKIDELQGEWREEWREDWRDSNGLLPEVTEKGHLIPKHVCQIIFDLIEEHKSGRRRSSEADGLFFSTFLDYSDRDKIPENFLSEWKAAKKWFLEHVHLREKTFCAGDENDLIKHFNCLDGYLYIASSSQYDRLKDLNEILDATNQ